MHSGATAPVQNKNCWWNQKKNHKRFSSSSVYRLRAWCRTNKCNSCECQNKRITYKVASKCSLETSSDSLSLYHFMLACQEWCPMQSGVLQQGWEDCQTFPAWLKRKYTLLGMKRITIMFLFSQQRNILRKTEEKWNILPCLCGLCDFLSGDRRSLAGRCLEQISSTLQVASPNAKLS